MKVKNILSFLAVLLPIQYFNISAGQKVLPTTGKIPIEISYDLGKTPLTRFKIIPQIETGTITTTDTEKTLKENIEVVINNPNSNKALVWLLVQDTKSGKVYETNKITIWNRNTYETYLRKLNATIGKWDINDKINK